MGETPVLTFGEELRRERLIREVSLEEISAATKISVRLLTALESSDVKKLPAPVFTRGFIRSYSRHLGLDPDEMVNAYLADLAPDKDRDERRAAKGADCGRGSSAAAAAPRARSSSASPAILLAPRVDRAPRAPRRRRARRSRRGRSRR